jgi:hypothetical protein
VARPDDGATVGTAGGFGRGQAIPLEEALRVFADCEAEPSMRSVTAILRVAREQTEARGSLRSNGFLAVLFIVLGLAEGAAYAAQIPLLKPYWPYGLASLLVGGLLAIGAVSIRPMARAAEVQKQIIAKEAVASLSRLAADPTWRRKPLDWSHRLTLERLVKSAKEGESLLESFPAD